MRRRTSRSAGTSSRRRLANAARSSSGWCAIELTESRFAIHSSRVLRISRSTSASRSSSNGPSSTGRRHSPGEHARQARHSPALERLVDHGLGLVADVRELDRDVPEDHERAARSQHARDLGDRLVRGEPVERLGREDRVDARVRERDRLAAAGQRLGARHDLLQHRPHRVVRLDGHDSSKPRHELASQLAGAGAEVEHLRLRPEAELGDHLVEQLLRPARPPELVLARGAPERVGRGFWPLAARRTAPGRPGARARGRAAP